jgi:hypothetical protein
MLKCKTNTVKSNLENVIGQFVTHIEQKDGILSFGVGNTDVRCHFVDINLNDIKWIY